MWENRVMHILLELHMWENRYRQFKDQSWNCTCGKRGSNQKVELHMWENVSPSGTIRFSTKFQCLLSSVQYKNTYYMYLYSKVRGSGKTPLGPSINYVVSRGEGRVSVQGVKSLGGHFACLCRGFEFYEV